MNYFFGPFAHLLVAHFELVEDFLHLAVGLGLESLESVETQRHVDLAVVLLASLPVCVFVPQLRVILGVVVATLLVVVVASQVNLILVVPN